MAHQLIGLGRIDVFLLKEVKDALRRKLLANPIGLHLDDVPEFRLHGLGQIKAKAVLHDISRAAFARLRVDTDNGLVLAAHVSGSMGR